MSSFFCVFRVSCLCICYVDVLFFYWVVSIDNLWPVLAQPTIVISWWQIRRRFRFWRNTYR